MFRSLLPKVLLVFALLLTQLGGLTHSISHALSEQNQSSDQSLPHDKHCDLCAAYAQVGGVIASSNISFVSGKNIEIFVSDCSNATLPARFVSFAARAPPYSA